VIESTLSLPYAFYNESFGFAVGYVYGVVGRPQQQATLLATAIAGSKGSAMGFLVGRDLQMPRVDRLFMDPIVSVGYFKDSEAFIDGNPDFPDQRAGSNDSDADNYVKGNGWDNFFRLEFKYLLPIGNGRDQIIATYKIKDGLLESGATGGTSLNPFKSGKTYLETHPFYRSQQIDGDDVDETTKTTVWIFRCSGITAIFTPTLQGDLACGGSCRGISAGLTARIPGQIWRVSWMVTFRFSWVTGSAKV